MDNLQKYIIIDTFIRKRILIGFKKLNKKYIEKSFERYCKSYCKRTNIECDKIPDIIKRIKELFGNKIEFYESDFNTIGILSVRNK